MSFQAMSWAYEQKVPDAECKLLLLALANYAGHDNSCWPSIPRLAKECLLSERTIQRRIDDLVTGGFIRCDKRQTSPGINTTNLYWLKISEAVSQSPGVVSGSHQGGVQQSPPPGVSQSPKPVISSKPVIRTEVVKGDNAVEFPIGFPQTEDQAVKESMTAGVPEDFVRREWNECAGANGFDRSKRPITKWAFHVKGAWGAFSDYTKRQENRFTGSGSNKPYVPPRKQTIEEQLADCLR